MPESSTDSVVSARAPGKLVFLGEYAVLNGAPAVVGAVDRYAVGTRRAARSWTVAATKRDWPEIAFTPGTDPLPDGPLQLVCGLLSVMACAGHVDAQQPQNVQIDSSALFAGQGKLGLGSSAAVLVACHRCFAPDVNRIDAFEQIDHAHRQCQQGLGSGLDVAAALAGGLTVFQRGDAVSIRDAALPVGVHWCAVYTGKSVSTGHFLNRLEHWRASHRAHFDEHMRALGDLAHAGVRALEKDDGATFCTVAGEYGAAMARLGKAARINIQSDEHTELRRLAVAHGVTYKPSGAGGGDVGLAFTQSAEAMARFQHAVRSGQSGFSLLSLGLAKRSAK